MDGAMDGIHAATNTQAQYSSFSSGGFMAHEGGDQQTLPLGAEEVAAAKYWTRPLVPQGASYERVWHISISPYVS
eukprot:gene5117-34920_t